MENIGSPLADAGIPFCIEIHVLPGNKAEYKLYFRNITQPPFALEPACIVGTVWLNSDLPITYEAHPSLALTMEQLQWFERFVREQVRKTFPGIIKMFHLAAAGQETVQFIPATSNDLWLMFGSENLEGT